MLYGEAGEADADVIVALGGDGHMLDTLRRRLKDKKPVYGMHRGTDRLPDERVSARRICRSALAKAEPIRVRPLVAKCETAAGIVERARLQRSVAVSANRADGEAAHLHRWRRAHGRSSSATA